jgi:rubrerythrin
MEELKQILQRGFVGEARAHLLYYFFAHKAEEEINLTSSSEIIALLKEAAALFRDISEQEKYHAFSYLTTLDGVGDTSQNLQDAIEGENKDFLTYSEAASTARSVGEEEVAQKFERIASVEKRHAALYQAILQRFQEILLDERLGKRDQAPGE